jgi:hypothetical protein
MACVCEQPHRCHSERMQENLIEKQVLDLERNRVVAQ